jgi:hypothetical protein
MMVLSSAAVLGGRFEEEADFAAFADFDLAEVFLNGFFRGLVLYGFLARVPAGWIHPDEKDSRQINMLEQILVGEVIQLRRDLL